MDAKEVKKLLDNQEKRFFNLIGSQIRKQKKECKSEKREFIRSVLKELNLYRTSVGAKKVTLEDYEMYL